MSVPLPTPEGPVMTRIGVVIRLAALAAQERDELVALALGQAADGLARRDAAVREDAIHLHAPVLRHRQQQVEDLRGEQVVGRIQQQAVDLSATALRSRLRRARRVRISLARFRASILCVSERSGANPAD